MLAKSINKNLELNHLRGQTRKRYVIQQRDTKHIALTDESLLNFTHNDYLNLSTHPRVIQAFIRNAEKFGVGSGASAAVSGYYTSHRDLEEYLADFLQRDRAIVFNSGYLANLGVLSTLANRESTILSDKRCHASILDGIKLSRATHYRYHHNHVLHANNLLNKHQADLLITEGVFSMEGDVCPANEFAVLAKYHRTTLILDDSHGIGIMGPNGGGTCEHFQLSQHDVPCLIASLGKAFGSMGAIVAGQAVLIENILQFARSYRYTTALPPAIAAASLEALKIMRKETWRREKLQSLIAFFNQHALEKELTLVSNAATPIKSILIGDNQLAEEIQKKLIGQGFFVSCIRPPTVPLNTARIRISLNCMHDEKDIIRLIDQIALTRAAVIARTPTSTPTPSVNEGEEEMEEDEAIQGS